MKQRNTILLAILIIAMIYILGVKKSFSQVTDYDGNIYKTVKIGTQEWTTENLNVSHYRNGDVIPQVTDVNEWENLTTGAWCYYQNNTENGITYGKLYNWYAINDRRGLAPKGWHIPSDAEWTRLTEYLGGKEKKKTNQGIDYWFIADVGGKLKATTLWNIPNTGATNETGFTAFPGGVRYHNGIFNSIGKYGYFWSSSEDDNDNDNAWYRYLYYSFSDVYRHLIYKTNGFSIRCVKD